jgi:hypothetical protein
MSNADDNTSRMAHGRGAAGYDRARQPAAAEVFAEVRSTLRRRRGNLEPARHHRGRRSARSTSPRTISIARCARSPPAPSAAESLARLKQFVARLARPVAARAGTRFLLIKSWGCGFWSTSIHARPTPARGDHASHARHPLGPRADLAARRSRRASRDSSSRCRAWTMVAAREPCPSRSSRRSGTGREPATEPLNQSARPDVAHAGAVSTCTAPEPLAVADFFTGPVGVLPWVAGVAPSCIGRPLDDAYPPSRREILRPVPHLGEAVRTDFSGNHLAGPRDGIAVPRPRHRTRHSSRARSPKVNAALSRSDRRAPRPHAAGCARAAAHR